MTVKTKYTYLLRVFAKYFMQKYCPSESGWFNTVLQKFNNRLPWSSLISIYTSFVRPHLDYGDVIFDKTYNNFFQQKLESDQYKASLAITGATKGSSTEKPYQELWLEPLQHRRWFRKLCIFYKIVKKQSQKYLFDLIPSNSNSYQTRYSQN